MKYCHQVQKTILGNFTFHQQLEEAARDQYHQLNQKEKKILIIHTGGTIGMFRDEDGKFRPQKNKFKEYLQNYPYFCDSNETYFNSTNDFKISPPSVYQRKIWYKFKQLDQLIDSTNSNLEKINTILKQIQKEYNNYDGFIILHGTDTMSYTASALSFMIENLKKTVILTGAQIPIGQVRNDSINNLICSLTVAGHYVIPEVLLVFDNKILRGNRSTKTSASNLNSFKSPNFIPLGQINLKINIHWELIRHSLNDQPTKFIPLKQYVEIMRITPLSLPTIPTSKYVVIQSFGIGNIPTEGPYHKWLKSNSQLPPQQQKVIVNISQVYQSVILNLYATGYEAQKLGLIPGSDMTCQAAMAKLSYLATKGYQGAQLKHMMMTNLREQLTEPKDRLLTTKTNYIPKCMTLLQKSFEHESISCRQMVKNIVLPLLVGQKSSKTAINKLNDYQLDVNYIYPDGSNILHYYARMVKNDPEEIFLYYLIHKKVNMNLIDNQGNSALFYALETEKYTEASVMKQYGGELKTTCKRIFQCIRNQQITLLHALCKFKDQFKYINAEKRNSAMYAAILKKQNICQFFNDFTDLFSEENLKVKDIYGCSLAYYLQKFQIKLE